jgi:hypothetical protein
MGCKHWPFIQQRTNRHASKQLEREVFSQRSQEPRKTRDKHLMPEDTTSSHRVRRGDWSVPSLPVHDLVLVQVFDGVKHLVEETARHDLRILRGGRRPILHVVQQVAPRAKVHDQVNTLPAGEEKGA